MEATTAATSATATAAAATGSARTIKTVDAQKVLDIFNSSIDVSKPYSLDELKKLVTQVYKDASKKKKGSANGCGAGGSSKDSSVKRAPTKYNIFVKDEMAKLREQHPEKEFKELMKLAAEKWNENKAGDAEKVSEETTA
jgi:hypothetical protein